MTEIVGVLAVLPAVITMVPAAAHVLELPGKLRLSRAEYAVVQRIYYPGFTRAGLAEVPAVLMAAAALAVTPTDSADFALRSVALAALATVQAVYWLQVHPVNRFWLANEELDRFSAGFFATGRRLPDDGEGNTARWQALRARWESGHVLRAVFATAAVVTLVAALA